MSCQGSPRGTVTAQALVCGLISYRVSLQNPYCMHTFGRLKARTARHAAAQAACGTRRRAKPSQGVTQERRALEERGRRGSGAAAQAEGTEESRRSEQLTGRVAGNGSAE
jgi:hypothetical protein